MVNKEEKLKNLLFGIVNKLSKDADVYHHNGSLWLIHTVSRKWIVEFTKEKTLWYNYNFFRSAFKFVSLDINNKADYVTEWFESRFLNKLKVDETWDNDANMIHHIEDTIQSGVKRTYNVIQRKIGNVEDAIESGVKRTYDMEFRNQLSIEKTIRNGVKDTKLNNRLLDLKVEDTIQNGVKESREVFIDMVSHVEDTIENGVKETIDLEMDDEEVVEYFIENGVKVTKRGGLLDPKKVEDTIENGVKKTDFNMYRDNNAVEDTIQNGVKEMQPLPAQDGNRDWGNYYHGKEDRTKPFNEYLDEAIRFGVKETHDDCTNNIGRVDGVIKVGKKIN